MSRSEPKWTKHTGQTRHHEEEPTETIRGRKKAHKALRYWNYHHYSQNVYRILNLTYGTLPNTRIFTGVSEAIKRTESVVTPQGTLLHSCISDCLEIHPQSSHNSLGGPSTFCHCLREAVYSPNLPCHVQEGQFSRKHKLFLWPGLSSYPIPLITNLQQLFPHSRMHCTTGSAKRSKYCAQP